MCCFYFDGIKHLFPFSVVLVFCLCCSSVSLCLYAHLGCLRHTEHPTCKGVLLFFTFHSVRLVQPYDDIGELIEFAYRRRTLRVYRSECFLFFCLYCDSLLNCCSFGRDFCVHARTEKELEKEKTRKTERGKCLFEIIYDQFLLKNQTE